MPSQYTPVATHLHPQNPQIVLASEVVNVVDDKDYSNVIMQSSEQANNQSNQSANMYAQKRSEEEQINNRDATNRGKVLTREGELDVSNAQREAERRLREEEEMFKKASRQGKTHVDGEIPPSLLVPHTISSSSSSKEEEKTNSYSSYSTSTYTSGYKPTEYKSIYDTSSSSTSTSYTGSSDGYQPTEYKSIYDK